jgi:hypothetical protein
MNIKLTAKIGLLICFLYFIIITLLIMFSNYFTILFMDIITIISGIYMVLFVGTFPLDRDKNIFRLLAIIFASSCMLITSMIHWINILALNQLSSKGINIPEYFQIGKWPSVLMAIEYLGWGFFMGLAFILSGCFIQVNTKLKKYLWFSGILCLLGFFGVIINENLWYIAPFGYGIGTVIICIKILLLKTENEKINFKG